MPGRGLGGHVDEDTVLERCREHHAGTEALPGPLDRARRRLVLEFGRDRGQLGQVDVDPRLFDGDGIEEAHVAAHSPSPTSAT